MTGDIEKDAFNRGHRRGLRFGLVNGFTIGLNTAVIIFNVMKIGLLKGWW